VDVLEAIKSRRSIRSYTSQAIEDEKLHAVLEAARLAPSASNRQDWKFVVVRDAALRRQVAEVCSSQMFIAQAPVVIVACTTNPERTIASGYPCSAVDLSIAVDHMTLAAASLGLGTCWIGAFNTPKVAALIDLPPGVAPVHVLPLGYPAEQPGPRARKSLDDIVCDNKYR
jgi:nitroreductase